MSTDKIPTITESALSNEHTRTIIHGTLAPGATTFPHYHTLFSETFTLLTGSMTIYTSPDLDTASFQAHLLAPGESFTVPPLQLHNFLVGDEETTSRVTFEPGNLDFERGMLIMAGTQRDGIYQGHFSQAEDNAVYMAVMGELLNATAVGETKVGLDKLYADRGEEVHAMKRKLVARYASEKHMRDDVK
jgi:quercetin dioxygenase-like cupin family protein